jgi:hypothetical protein
MHIKRRGNRALLYRSSWVPKGSVGNTHGYSTQTFVGSLSADAELLPKEMENKLSSEELEYLENKIFRPARLASEETRRRMEHKKIDPIWRLDEAARLSAEAAELSERAAVPNGKVAAIHLALAKLRTISPIQSTSVVAASPGISRAVPSSSDPLRDALSAIKAARNAVSEGRYGTAPPEGVRTTNTYKLWSEIFEAVGGTSGESLLRALQAKGFAKMRSK